MTRLTEILERQTAIQDRLRAIQALDTPGTDATDEQRAAYDAAPAELDALLTEWDTLDAERIPLAERQAKVDTALARSAPAPAPAAVVPAQRTYRTEDGDGTRNTGPQVIIRKDPFDVLTDRSLHGRALERALVDGNLRALEAAEIGDAAGEKSFEKVIKRHAGDTRWAENILARQRPEYASAFAKVTTDRAATMNEEERAAIAIGTNTAGGYLVPTHLDPTLILTNNGSTNAMRQYARTVTLSQGNVWHGVTTAGVTASWDAELAEVSDDSPAVASVSITVGKPQAFIQATIEAWDDIANLDDDVRMLFADARNRLEGSGFLTGLGSSNQPTGLFTAINASASLQTTSTTAATIGEVDIHALYRALPQRWRGAGSFVMNPLYSTAIKRLGTAVSSTYSGDLREPVSDRILGRPVVESDDAPTTQTTTALDQEIAFADLTQYVIVDRPGSASVEFIPHLFATANNLPDGRRGWYFHWRVGGGFPNIAAGRILVDKTSA